MSNGKVVQVIGAVVDVEFPRDAIPGIYDALRIADANLTLEGPAAARRRRGAHDRDGRQRRPEARPDV